jgi:hypothetical protein
MTRVRLLRLLNPQINEWLNCLFPLFGTLKWDVPVCRRKSTNVAKDGATVILEELNND